MRPQCLTPPGFETGGGVAGLSRRRQSLPAAQVLMLYTTPEAGTIHDWPRPLDHPSHQLYVSGDPLSRKDGRADTIFLSVSSSYQRECVREKKGRKACCRWS